MLALVWQMQLRATSTREEMEAEKEDDREVSWSVAVCPPACLCVHCSQHTSLLTLLRRGAPMHCPRTLFDGI
jgi:hypothetical protein